MYFQIFKGIMLPFLGTTLGSSCVFFMKKRLGEKFREAINGFAGGVMIAASVWSLLIPAMEYESSQKLGMLSFFPALLGMWLGIGFLLLADKFLPAADDELSLSSNSNKMLFLSVTIHNLPEGMAVGAVYATLLSGGSPELLGGALALSLGIALQNFPEGAIISMPLAGSGTKKHRAFLYGVTSGIVEPIGAFITLLAVAYILPLLPILLGFAAGAMIYVVLKELLPILVRDEKSIIGILMFVEGFSFMMMLDVALG